MCESSQRTCYVSATAPGVETSPTRNTLFTGDDSISGLIPEPHFDPPMRTTSPPIAEPASITMDMESDEELYTVPGVSQNVVIEPVPDPSEEVVSDTEEQQKPIVKSILSDGENLSISCNAEHRMEYRTVEDDDGDDDTWSISSEPSSPIPVVQPSTFPFPAHKINGMR